MTKHMIWSSSINIDDWMDDLKEQYPDLSESEYYSLANEINGEYLDDERTNLSSQKVPNGILVIADLGFWNGRRSGIKELNAASISDCLRFETDCEDAEWYVDSDGELHSIQSHHDGTHYLKYRAWKGKLSKKAKNAFIELFKAGWTTDLDLNKHTFSLGEKIAKVYGWDLKEEAATKA